MVLWLGGLYRMRHHFRAHLFSLITLLTSVPQQSHLRGSSFQCIEATPRVALQTIHSRHYHSKCLARIFPRNALRHSPKTSPWVKSSTRRSPKSHRPRRRYFYFEPIYPKFSSEWYSGPSEWTYLHRAVPISIIHLVPSPPPGPRISPLRYPRRRLSRLDKARLRLWLLRHINGANLLRALIHEIEPAMAELDDLQIRLRAGIFLLRDLKLFGPPLHKLIRLPPLFMTPPPSPRTPEPSRSNPITQDSHFYTEWSPPDPPQPTIPQLAPTRREVKPNSRARTRDRHELRRLSKQTKLTFYTEPPQHKSSWEYLVPLLMCFSLTSILITLTSMIRALLRATRSAGSELARAANRLNPRQNSLNRQEPRKCRKQSDTVESSWLPSAIEFIADTVLQHQIRATPAIAEATPRRPASRKQAARKLLCGIILAVAMQYSQAAPESFLSNPQPNILQHRWWHQGISALGRRSTACEEGDHVASTRSGGAAKSELYNKTFYDKSSRAIPIKGLAPLARKLVCVKTSLIQDAGKGLFAARDICTYATNIKSRAQQKSFKICPYAGEKPDETLSDYVMRVGDVTIDAWRINSCWARYANDALDIELDNVTAILIDGVIWLVPLPGVEILNHQELYIAYDWEYWYRKWETCNPQLRARILARYPIHCSAQTVTNTITELERLEHQRISDFWYEKWSWWTPTMRKQILRSFPLSELDRCLYRVEAHTSEYAELTASDSDTEPEPSSQSFSQEHFHVDPDTPDAPRRHEPTEPLPADKPQKIPAPWMLGPKSAPTTLQLPQSDIDQSDRPRYIREDRKLRDPNPCRPAKFGVNKPHQVWAAEPRKHRKVPTNMFTEISGIHWKNYCKSMDSWCYPDDDITGIIPNITSDIRVGYLNINRLEDHNFDYICWFYENRRLDVLFLIDTRLTVLGGQYANAKIKERLGNDILILQSKTRPEPGSGGQLAIVRPHLRRHLVNEETDPANLGVLFALSFKHGLRTLALISVYWPCETQGPDTLRSRLNQYMTATNRGGTISNYCRHLVENVVDRTMRDPFNTCIAGGDWNANWQDSRATPKRSHSSLAGWAQDIGLSHAHKALIEEPFDTRFPSLEDELHEPTAIDHILTTQSACVVTEASISNAPTWIAVSDHRPLWIAVRLDTPLSKPAENPPPIPNVRRVELDRKDPAMCEEYRAHLRVFILDQKPDGRDGEDLGEWVENICASSVNIVRAHMKPAPKASRHRRDGTSPTYKVLNKSLATAIRIRQFLTGQGRKTKWQDWYTPIGVKKEIDRLRVYATRELPDHVERDKVLSAAGSDPSMWLTVTPTEADMTRAAKLLMKAMQGRKRTEKRRQMVTTKRNREAARQEHKYARWIKSLVGKQRITYDMDKLNLMDGTTECDARKIHDILTAWFGKWFADDRDRAGSLHHQGKWTEFLNDRRTFDELLAHTTVEEWVKDGLWNSMQQTAIKLTPESRAELAETLRKPPSYEEFVERLIKPRGGPTAGLTGLTFNMMAEWPQEIMEAVYKALCKLDESSTVPLYWKNKALIPMPKAPNPTLEQLRPLMLIEVLRKVWCGFSVRAVWQFLEKHHVLEDIQFAYRRGREAGVAQLCIRNSIEEAQETESALLLGSYDQYHAFDMLSRSSMKLSFTIVGLDGAEASRLVDMEDDSHVTVSTPLARHHWASKYTRTLHRGESQLEEPAFFIPLQGTPQGDTISCLTWTVFENICLAALCNDPGRVKLYIRGSNGLIYEAADLCYADDLNTVSPTLAGMQRKADIICGLAEILHLRISIKKLRQVAVDFGPQKLLPEPCALRVNDGTGKIETVTIPSKGPFDQLGYRNSVGAFSHRQRPDLEQFIRTKTFLIAVCRSIKKKCASAMCKLVAVELSVFNTALWRAQCSPWSLAMCQELDRPINQLFRHITKNLPGFSNNLLHAKAPGLNLPCLSDGIQIRKIALVQRGITNPPMIAAGPDGLIQRSSRSYGLVTIPGNRMTFGPAQQYNWTSSLLHRLKQCQLFMTIGGKDPSGTHEEQLNSHTNQGTILDRDQVGILMSCSIHTYGDLIEQREDSSRWTDTTALSLDFLNPLLEDRELEHRPTVLRAGSCWTIADGSILEYLGRLAKPDGPPLMFRRWMCPYGVRLGATLHLSADTPSLGAGTDLVLNYEDVWNSSIATRAITKADLSYPRGNKSITRTLINEFNQLNPSIIAQPARICTPAEGIVDWLKSNGIEEDAYEIFTDGAWKDHAPWLQHCFHGSDPDDTISSASVVCVHIGEDRWTKPGLITRITPSTDLKLSSGYPAELTALLCASQVARMWRPAAIITDCESAYNIIQKGFLPRAEQKKNHATLARLLVRYSRDLRPTMYRHTHSHLDKYLPPSRHTEDQRGNILADHSASCSEEHALWVTQHYPQLTRRATTMKSVHESFINDIPLCVSNGSTPALLSLHNTFSAQNFKQYISDRLVKSTHGNLYRDASYNFCTEVFELDKVDNITHKASCVRLIFDKVWQPWNTQKYKFLAPPTCPHCDVEDSMGHLLAHCSQPAISNLRRAALNSARQVVSQGDDIIHAVFDSMIEIMTEPHGESIWRGLWLPRHIESLRTKLHLQQIITLDERCITHDSPRSRAIHSALLDINKIFGQASLNMMRERTAQTRAALNPLNIQRTGKIQPPPLALYNRQAKFHKKIKSTKVVLPPINSRMVSLFPPFVKPVRKHPRVLAQEYRRELELEANVVEQAARCANGARAATTYAEPIVAEPEIIQPWDPRVFLHYNPGVNNADLDQSAAARWRRTIQALENQAQRADIHDNIIRTANRREADAQDRIMEEIDRRDPQAQRRPAHKPRRFTRAGVEANERWSELCAARGRTRAAEEDSQADRLARARAGARSTTSTITLELHEPPSNTTSSAQHTPPQENARIPPIAELGDEDAYAQARDRLQSRTSEDNPDILDPNPPQRINPVWTGPASDYRPSTPPSVYHHPCLDAGQNPMLADHG